MPWSMKAKRLIQTSREGGLSAAAKTMTPMTAVVIRLIPESVFGEVFSSSFLT